MQPDEILQRLRPHKAGLGKLYGLKRLALFGESARYESAPDRSVQLVAEFEVTPGPFDIIRLESCLGELLGEEVDLVVKDALKPHISRRLLEEAMPV